MTKKLIPLLAGWALGLLLLTPTHGYAVSAFQAGVTCRPVNSTTAHTLSSGAIVTGAASSYNCPFPSGSYIRHTVVNDANIAGYDPSATGNVVASLCVRDYTNIGSAATIKCGTTTNNGINTITGAYVLTPDRSTWNNASYTSWYPYYNVTLNAASQEITGLYAAAP